MKISNIHILLLRLALGGIFLSGGLEKLQEGWLQSSEPLKKSFEHFHQNASGPQLTYLTSVADPYAELWSKLVPIGETAVGVSLLLGLLARFSSVVGLFMVLNFHAAVGNLFSLKFFGTAWAALIIVSFLIMILTRAGRWAGVDALLAKSNPKGIFL